MVDREKLRETTKSAGRSIAGTFKRGAKAAKEKAKSFGDTTKQGARNIKRDVTGRDDQQGNVDLVYSQEADQYIVFVDGQPTRQFDDELAAKAYARKLMRNIDQKEERVTSRKEQFREFATRFAEGVNETVADLDDVDETETPEQEAEDTRSPSIPAFGQTADGGAEPTLTFLDDDSDTGGPTLGFDSGMDSEPSVPGFGGDDSGEPRLPFEMGGDDRQEQDVQLPFMDEPDGKEPIFPDFDRSKQKDTQDYPWLF